MPLPAAHVVYIRWFAELGLDDIPLVGGKNASLGEMYRTLSTTGVNVPPGFAITADAYRAPSDYPEFAQFLVEQGIESMSLNPDAVLKTLLTIV